METESSKINLPGDECTKELDLFFSNELFNSCKATDELIKRIEESQNEALARKALAFYQERYSKLERPWKHVTFMYGLGLIYMHFNAYDWAAKAFRETIYVQPSFARSRDIHTRLGLIFKAIGSHTLSEKHFNLAIHDKRPLKDSDDIPTQDPNEDETENLRICVDDNSSAESVIEALKSLPTPKKIDINLLNNEQPPHMFPKPPPYPPLPQDKLFPSPPTIFLETKKDLASKRLQECCQSNPISVVRNLANVLKLDLGLFSTKTLVESNPNQHIDVLTHLLFQTNDTPSDHGAKGKGNNNPNTNTSGSMNSLEDNVGNNDDRNQWSSECHKSSSTISQYANYQVSSFRESLNKEREAKSGGTKASQKQESETDSNESNSTQAKRLNNNNSQSANQLNNYSDGHQNSRSPSRSHTNKKLKKDHQPKIEYVKSADRIDLSDEKKWRVQLNELNKLPNFMKYVSASNMLTHIGTSVTGINTVVMSMNVPGCRILGNTTSGRFCTLNINVGPGDYEWCAISMDYGSILTRLCNRNGFELGQKNWWPRISDLQRHNIPVYRFSQRPGDLVWVNTGTIFWIRAVGWCNSINWNVGPLSARQYKLASESYELNKLLFRKSDVPMVQMTWNIIMNINYIPDDEFNHELMNVLRKSLRYCILVRDLVEKSNHKVHQLDVKPRPQKARYCSLCESEVFNIHFQRKDNEYATHCVECARRSSQTFENYKVKQDYSMENLMRIYDGFIRMRSRFQARPINNKCE